MADEPQPKTGLDDALSLEATYYATPIPQSMAVLTILEHFSIRLGVA